MHQLQIARGTIHVVDQGKGRVLLLVHGFPLDHTMWSGQISELSKVYRVIAPDLRGFGRSGSVKGTVTMQEFAEDLIEMLDALGIHQRVDFCGLSMGGYIGWQMWDHFAPRIASLILCDTRAAADSVEVAKGRQLMAQSVELEGTNSVADSMVPKLFATSTLKERSGLVDATIDVIHNTHPHSIAAAQRGMALRRDMTDRLPEIDIPTLLLCGSEDQITPPHEMRQVAADIPNSRFVEIERAGHMAPLEQPEAVNTAIKEFLPL